MRSVFLIIAKLFKVFIKIVIMHFCGISSNGDVNLVLVFDGIEYDGFRFDGKAEALAAF